MPARTRYACADMMCGATDCETCHGPGAGDPPVGQECACCQEESDIEDMNQHPTDAALWLCDTCDFDFDVCVGQWDDDCLSLKGDDHWVDRDLLVNEDNGWFCPSCSKINKGE
jgi:hypothetical protein